MLPQNHYGQLALKLNLESCIYICRYMHIKEINTVMHSKALAQNKKNNMFMLIKIHDLIEVGI